MSEVGGTASADPASRATLAAPGPVVAPPPADFLRSPLADVLCVVLFAGLGLVVAEAFWLLSLPARVLLAAIGAAVGPLACAVERGRERPFTNLQALAVAALAATGFALLAARFLAPAPAWQVAAGAGLVLLGGAALARAGARLDRGEAGWRAAVRAGPPDGTPPVALAIAAPRLPAPARWLLLPLELPVRLALLLAIRLYQLTFSRLMPPACRFEPTCSRYGFEAVWRHGAVRGTLLTGVRLLRCSPLSSGGLDPVPARHAPGCPGHEVESRPAWTEGAR